MIRGCHPQQRPMSKKWQTSLSGHLFYPLKITKEEVSTASPQKSGLTEALERNRSLLKADFGGSPYQHMRKENSRHAKNLNSSLIAEIDYGLSGNQGENAQQKQDGFIYPLNGMLHS